MQGGDVTFMTGQGGRSAGGDTLPGTRISHIVAHDLRFGELDEPGGNQEVLQGSISMVNIGRNSGGSQFFIHLDNNSSMRGSTVVFGTRTSFNTIGSTNPSSGKVTEETQIILSKLAEYVHVRDQPIRHVFVANCGVYDE